VLDGFDGDVVAGQAGGKLNPGEMLHGRRHLMVAQVGSSEADAGTSAGRLQRKANFVAGMKTDPDTRNGPTNCAL
jgi:hypothetical protein